MANLILETRRKSGNVNYDGILLRRIARHKTYNIQAKDAEGEHYFNIDDLMKSAIHSLKKLKIF